ncbi:MAG: protein-tyrosine-phosphatase [Kiritimatiellae bacterium]|nr:protein-tyrosine-phosphatase [Kiritimatiellia bacterium]
MQTQNIDLALPYAISVCGVGELSQFKTLGITHLLSIDSPGTPTTTPGWFKGTHWHVAFVDFESKKMAAIFGATPPAKKDVALILELSEMCLANSRTCDTHLLIHCLAGVSRSTAAAYAIICKLLGPGYEEAAFEYLLNIRPCASPNRLVVKYADQLLNRKGAMVKAAT